ncbi:MFS transporter [Streptomyces sp. XM4193]|uniref:MDR family MFS transporter n=1 Tax=Streptomyces sp. XM4193 TaxID=2929782 RepID=UPI001FFBE116|nr:MDR family MFS transporter [Streptomyces sp. XM4193]MCK1799116.1 MFS transporter [Streptomyces sp. XM4193]
MTNRQILQAMSGLMAGMFVAILAGTVVANALPRIVADLGATQSAYTWVVTSELLAMTATVPLWGKLSDLYNKKLLLQLSLGVFVLGSILAGLSQGVEMLIFSRVVQGIGAGGLTALVQVVMAAIVPPRRLGKYAGIFGSVFAVGTVIGPLVGGVLVDTPWLGWRWCFFIGVPFALVSVILLQRTLKLPTVRRPDAKVDYLGAFLIVGGVSALLIWTSLAGNSFDWASWQTAALTSLGVVMLGLAVYVETQVAEPIIPLGIFRSRTVTLATVASLFVGVAMFGGTVFLTQYFQLALGKSPTEAGLMSLPMIFGLLVSSTGAGQIISATGRWKVFVVSGAAIMTAGMGLLATIDVDTPFWQLSLYMALLGFGLGMLMQNLVLVAQNDVPARYLGSATSVVSFFRSMGGTVGTSVLGAVLAARVAEDIGAGMPAGAEGGGGHGAVPDLATLPGPVREVVENAYAAGTSELFLLATPFAALGLVAVLFLKEKPLKTTSGSQRLVEESKAESAQADLPGSDARPEVTLSKAGAPVATGSGADGPEADHR